MNMCHVAHCSALELKKVLSCMHRSCSWLVTRQRKAGSDFGAPSAPSAGAVRGAGMARRRMHVGRRMRSLPARTQPACSNPSSRRTQQASHLKIEQLTVCCFFS